MVEMDCSGLDLGYLHTGNLSVKSPLETVMAGKLKAMEYAKPHEDQSAANAPLFPKSAVSPSA